MHQFEIGFAMVAMQMREHNCVLYSFVSWENYFVEKYQHPVKIFEFSRLF